MLDTVFSCYLATVSFSSQQQWNEELFETEKSESTEKVKAFHIPSGWRAYQKGPDAAMDKMKYICYLVMCMFLLKFNQKS